MNTILCVVCVSDGITGNSNAPKLRGPSHSVTSCSHGAPVPSSQPQRRANTNRLSFIAARQKPARLEQNPPKTTTLSWGIIQSPNIRGNGRTLLHLSSNRNPTWRQTQGTRCGAMVQPHWHKKNRMWWIYMPEATGKPVCRQPRILGAAGANSGCVCTYLQKKVLFYVFCCIRKQTSG